MFFSILLTVEWITSHSYSLPSLYLFFFLRSLFTHHQFSWGDKHDLFYPSIISPRQSLLSWTNCVFSHFSSDPHDSHSEYVIQKSSSRNLPFFFHAHHPSLLLWIIVTIPLMLVIIIVMMTLLSDFFLFFRLFPISCYLSDWHQFRNRDVQSQLKLMVMWKRQHRLIADRRFVNPLLQGEYSIPVLLFFILLFLPFWLYQKIKNHFFWFFDLFFLSFHSFPLSLHLDEWKEKRKQNKRRKTILEENSWNKTGREGVKRENCNKKKSNQFSFFKSILSLSLSLMILLLLQAIHHRNHHSYLKMMLMMILCPFFISFVILTREKHFDFF